jgi:hypothetical protein
MNKIVVALSMVLVAIVAQPATVAATYSTKEEKSDARSASYRKGEGAIRVSAYLVGGPAGKSKMPLPASEVVVRVRRSGDSKKLIREAKSLRHGHGTFWVSPGVYQVEGALEPPESEVARRISCGSKIVHIHKNSQAFVKLYCPIR